MRERLPDHPPASTPADPALAEVFGMGRTAEVQTKLVKPYYDHAGITIYVGNCLDVLPTLTERFDACVTDPPYHLTTGKKGGSQQASLNLNSPAGRSRVGTGFMGTAWDGGDVAFRPETWTAIAESLKPGAHVMAFGGTRTFHRLTCAIEDAGFEIRDCLMWLYGSGFPKSLDISKAIDKAAGAERPVISTRIEHNICRPEGGGQERLMTSAGHRETKVVTTTAPATDEAKIWDGYGTALKPAWEPIVLGMKPLDGTFAENALGHGVAGLNVEAGRIGSSKDVPSSTSGVIGVFKRGHKELADRSGMDPRVGRWPANVILDSESAIALDGQSGELTSGSYSGFRRESKTKSTYGVFNGVAQENPHDGSRGGASRFFYCAKADQVERGTGNDHPTVKPLDLMRWLCKLLAPPTSGLFLDPFAGSGTTLLACKALNIRAIGIELHEHHAEIAAKRLSQEVLAF